jgi:hypothetical protein
MSSYFLFIVYYSPGSKMGTEKETDVRISARDVQTSSQISTYFVVLDPSYPEVAQDFH